MITEKDKQKRVVISNLDWAILLPGTCTVATSSGILWRICTVCTWMSVIPSGSEDIARNIFRCLGGGTPTAIPLGSFADSSLLVDGGESRSEC